MANWISNGLEIYGKNRIINAVLRTLKSDESEVDFKNLNRDFVRVDPDRNVTFVAEVSDKYAYINVETAYQSPDLEVTFLSKKYPSCKFVLQSHDGNERWETTYKNGQAI